MTKKFTTTQKTVASVHLIRVIIELFTSTFMTSHILSLNPETALSSGVYNIGLFYISEYIIYCLLYFIISYFVDKSNRVTTLRVSIFVSLSLLILLMICGEQISSWIIIAGILCGISDAFYYSSYFVMRNEVNPRITMKKYNMIVYVVTNLIKIIVPTILGYLIDLTSYSYISIYFLIICLIQFGLTFFIKCPKPKDSKFELRPFIKFLKENPEIKNDIKYTYINSFLSGFKNSYKVIVTILTIYTFKTNFSLGIFTSIFSLATIFMLLLYKKYDNNPKLNKFVVYLLIGLLPFIACIALVLDINAITLVIFNLFLTITIGFSDYFGTIERDTIIKNIGKNDFIAEHQFFVELYTTLTRIITYFLFIVVGLTANINIFKVLLIILIIVNPLKYFIMLKQRTIRKKYENLQILNSPQEEIIPTHSTTENF